jgi:hypothetical protein
MKHPWSPLHLVGAVVIAAGLIWSSGMLASAMPQSKRLHTDVYPASVIDYATDVVAPGSRFTNTRPTYDQ